MKNLTNEQIIQIIENCSNINEENTGCLTCPLFKECLYFLTGEECGSALETPDEDECEFGATCLSCPNLYLCLGSNDFMIYSED